MPSIDPSQLLKALSPLLLPSGAIRGQIEATRIVSLMKDANKLVSKCLYLNIVRATGSEEVLNKFISVGGWDTMNKWLQQAKDEENTPLLTELLKVYQGLPVTVDDLKKDNTARFIKSLNKHQDESVKMLSSSVVDSWMKIIKGKGSNDVDNDKSKKKKKKDKEREKDREKDSSHDKDRHRKDDKHSRSSDKKDHHSSHHSNKKDGVRRDSKESRDSRDSRDSNSSDKKLLSSSGLSDGVVQKDNGERSAHDIPDQIQERLSGDSAGDEVKSNSPSKEEEEEEKTRRKPKTARVFTNKFRSVFDEDDDPLPPIKKKTPEELKGGLPLPKRSSTDLKDEPPEKIPRLTLKMPSLIPDATGQSGTSPTNTSPPEVTHGRIKIIPPKRPPAHEIHDSNVFMNELTKSTYTHGVMKRKKKPTSVTTSGVPVKQPGVKSPTSSVAPTTPTTPTPATPTTPPTPVSPITAMAQKLPSVPSFYRDTLESTEDTETETAEEQKEASPPPLEKMVTDAADEEAQQNNNENEEMPSIDMEVKEDVSAVGETGVTQDGDADGEKKMEVIETTSEAPENASEQAEGLLAAGLTSTKKNKKKVSWAEESNLRQFFYFELDETERENVNRPKTFNELKKQEIMLEGRAMESAKRLINDNMVEVLTWRRPPLIDNIVIPVDPGCNSKEREIQQQREQGVLQALFFSKQMLPDSPSESDLESVEPVDTKIIPLEDETSSAEEYEHTYNLDPSSMPYDPAFDISQNLGGSGPGVEGGAARGGGVGNIQLPPDLSNILASIQQQSIATGGQSLQANSAVMGNVQSILHAIMNGGPGNNSEELINKLRVALEPLKNQISVPVSSMNQPDPNQFPPQGGPQRHGLLGNAPPGFNPMMGGPRPFGPQGPGMGRGMDGDGWNMGMGPGPGPMGPGFHPMQGLMMGGPRPRGPPMRGSRRGQRAVCRHFVAPGGCRFGNSCSFLHPGVNGPPLN